MIRGTTQYGVIKRISRIKTLLMLTHPTANVSHTSVATLRGWTTQRYAPAIRPPRRKPYLILRAVPFVVAVPDVRGLDQATAQAQIAARGLTSVVGGTATTTYPLNTVGIETPAQGTSQLLGTLITLTMSLGPVGTLPDFTGLTLADATTLIGQIVAILYQVIYEDQIYPYPEIPRDTVIGQYPLPGTIFNSSTQITLFVSSGRVYYPGLQEASSNDPNPVSGSTAFP